MNRYVIIVSKNLGLSTVRASYFHVLYAIPRMLFEYRFTMRLGFQTRSLGRGDAAEKKKNRKR